MIHLALNLFVLTCLFLLVGLVKPQLALFFMENPKRISVVVLSLVLFMICATLFGEGKRQERVKEYVEIQKKAPQILTDPEELPVAKPEKKTVKKFL